MRDREIESCGAWSWSGSEKVRAKNKKNPRLDSHLIRHVGWLIMMSYSVHWRDLAPHLYPFRKASPPETGMSPVSILNVVVFPAPLIPSKPKHWVETTGREGVSYMQASLENKLEAVVMDGISNFLYVDIISLNKSSHLTPLMNCIYKLNKYCTYIIETRLYSVHDCLIVY